MINLEWIFPEAPVVKVKVPKERRLKEKKRRRPDVQRTSQRAMNLRKGR